MSKCFIYIYILITNNCGGGNLNLRLIHHKHQDLLVELQTYYCIKLRYFCEKTCSMFRKWDKI